MIEVALSLDFLLLREVLDITVKDKKNLQQYGLIKLGSVTDPQILESFVDGLVFVVRRGYVSKEKVHVPTTSLQNLNTIILGYVLNDVPRIVNETYYYQSNVEQPKEHLVY